MIYAMWHGGSSYSQGDIDTDLETFASMKDAGRALRERARHGYSQPQTFNYADGRTENVLCPCADEAPTMTVYRYDPRETTDPYPDTILSIGPRGGIVRESC
jgi:hypothetical protein